MLESRKNATLEENVGEKSKLKKNVEIGKKESESDEKCWHRRKLLEPKNVKIGKSLYFKLWFD